MGLGLGKPLFSPPEPGGNEAGVGSQGSLSDSEVNHEKVLHIPLRKELHKVSLCLGGKLLFQLFLRSYFILEICSAVRADEWKNKGSVLCKWSKHQLSRRRLHLCVPACAEGNMHMIGERKKS